jgi:hypothetical protein
MALKVNPETVKQADQCPRDHACLKGGQTCCTIRNTINETVFFTTCEKPSHCPYQMAFGHLYMCNCPVRKELYIKHWL